ncbi:DUF6056 family protein [Spirosoma sp. KNUC1025]|uniref:DUF6056 family protein n=1 Tax=Spirosoma sp. KNUC1025 TaxID=2894082 RepID=UPI003869A9F3|nr:DUF6056 family protein [Spirosoma sp. KNUC1025]
MSTPFSRIVTVLLVVFAIVVLLPLIALATYNHPSPTDDYCFANTVLHYGFWQAQQFYYDGWTGRYFHNFIVHTNPVVIGWYGGYKIYPVVLLALVVGGCYALASQWLTRYAETSVKLGVAMGVFIGFITTLAGIPEYLYWYTGLASYGLSSTLFLFLLAVLMAHQRREFGLQPGYLLAESLLVTAIVGSSEMTMVLVMSVLGFIAFVELIQRRRLSAAILILLGVGLVSCYYLMKAPGNAIRLGGNPNGSDIPFTIKASLRFAAEYVPKQLLLTPWVPLSLLYLPVAWKLVEARQRAGDLPPYLRLHPALGLLYCAGTVLALISLHLYGVGIPPIPRLINLVNLAFWLGLLYCLTLFVVALRHRIQPARIQSYIRSGMLVAIVWAIGVASVGTVLPVVYGDWLSGRAAEYDRAMLERYRQLAESNNPESLLAPLPNYPVSLFLEDIHTDPKHLWNRCWADYFHKKTITLTDKPGIHLK